MSFSDVLAKAGVPYTIDVRAPRRPVPEATGVEVTVAQSPRFDKVIWIATNKTPMPLAVVDRNGRVLVLRAGVFGEVIMHAPDGVLSEAQESVKAAIASTPKKAARAEAPPTDTSPDVAPAQTDGEPSQTESDEDAPAPKKKATKKKVVVQGSTDSIEVEVSE